MSGNDDSSMVLAPVDDMVRTVPCRYGAMSFFPFDGPIGDALDAYGEWAQAEIEFLARLVPRGGVIVDAGANVGTHALAFAAMVGDTGMVYAVEAQPQVFDVLRRNLAQNGVVNVRAVNAAVSSAAGAISIPALDPGRRQNIGALSLAAGAVADTAGGPSARVPMVTLDSLCRDRVDLLKIDVEAMELDVLRGAGGILERSRPPVYLECNDIEHGWQIVTFFRDLDYQAYFCRFPAFNGDNFRGRNDNMFGVAEESSLLFVPRERVEDTAPAVSVCRAVRTLDELAAALLATPRYGDRSAIDRDPERLRHRIDSLEAQGRALAAAAQEHGVNLERALCGAAARIREGVKRSLALVARHRQPTPLAPCATVYEILIPIYNAHDCVKVCVESVLRHTDPVHPVILLDDASTDTRILPLLRGFAEADPRVRVLRSDKNMGFVGNINRGFARARHDVVILNSDTEVTPQWLERLDRCRRSDPAIGVVSPLSNNATILSVPVMSHANRLPDGMSASEFAALVAEVSPRCYPRLPTAVGFCMLITRDALDRLGPFDTAFGLGYGEESDFCMRAWQRGIETACCDDAYVHHYGEASFSSVKQIGRRRLRNMRLLSERWPYYDTAVQVYCHHNPLRVVQERLRAALERSSGESRPHVLHVIHAFDVPGGTELHTRRLVDGLAGRYRSTVVLPASRGGDKPIEYAEFESQRRGPHLRVVKLRERNIVPQERFLGIAADLENPVVEGNFTRLAAGGDYDIVHFQHLSRWDSLLLPVLAKALGKLVVLSLHDYFLLCPEYNLMLPEYRRCGRSHADADDPQCLRCLGAKRNPAIGESPGPLDRYLRDRFALVRQILETADILIAPSVFVREQFRRALGDTVAEKIRVVPHGVMVTRPSPRPERGSALRVGFLGNLTDRKGAHTVLDAAARLRGEPVRFEVFGGVQDDVKGRAAELGVTMRGNYTLERLPDLLARVDVVVVPSVWDETYCQTVSEAQAMGVPVVATAVGAIPERVVEGVTGFLVPPSDAQALAERLLVLARDPGSLAPVHQGLAGLAHKTMEDNLRDYDAIYAELLRDEEPTRPLLTELLKVADGKVPTAAVEKRKGDAYVEWLERHEPAAEQLEGLRQRVGGRTPQPLIHLVVMLSGEGLGRLPETLDALLAQRYERWRLSVVADLPVCDPLFEQHPALRWVEAEKPGWLEAVNRLNRDVEADWVGVIDPGDRFDPALLLQCVDHIQRHRQWRFVYTDEDRIGADGVRCEPRLKPEVNLEWLRAQAYPGRFCLAARAALVAAGGYGCLGGLEAYDAVLRIIEQFGEEAVGHVPHVLYHRHDANRASGEHSTVLGIAVVKGHLKRSGIDAVVEPGIAPHTWRVDYTAVRAPRVAVVVHGEGSAEEAAATASSVLQKSTYAAMDVWLSLEHRAEEVRRSLGTLAGRDPRMGLLESHQEVDALGAEYLLFVSDGTMIVQPNWIERLVAQALQPRVGIVGARVVGPDQRITGIGRILGLGPEGIAAALQPGLSLSAPGYFGRAQVAQDMSAVAGDCLLVDKAVYADIGLGLPAPNLRYRDTEICLQARERGRRVVWTPHATVFAGRPDARKAASDTETAAMRARWLPALADDPAYHPALCLERDDVVLEGDLPVWSPRDNHDLPRILGMGFGSPGSWQYRGAQPLHALARHALARTAEVTTHRDRVRAPNPTELARLGVDGLLLYNTVHDVHIEALRRYRRFNDLFIAFGQDDLMSALPARNPLRRLIYKDIKKRLRGCLAVCDRLIVTTEALGRHFRHFIDDIRVVPNRLDRRWGRLEPRRRVSRKPRVGWAGALQHEGDLQLLAEAVLETAGEVDWVFMGMCPEQIRSSVKEFHGPVSFDDYPAALAALNLDLAVAPLEHNAFNEAKSNLRILEYGALGCPVICTDIEPYRNAPVTRVSNTTRAWVNAIREHVSDPDAAEREGDHLRAWVRAHWMLEDHLEDWLDALRPESDRSVAAAAGSDLAESWK